ncbi:unnamed protein product [Tuber melanosporum]|uniref:(Perigord truffle) hypothetical protein n=1 Tax=Tuber melanosporum (strain Mel28) TaxID=656061 RepID=D5GCW8_TUBMM|nr:uncharacterized protein GSTUM_00000844001 [Tuber melanosporum]CAZ82361.1 unnamed protein product [Tuber melanosporum]
MANDTPSHSPRENTVATTEGKAVTSPAAEKDAQVDKPNNTDQANTDCGDKMDVDEGSAIKSEPKTAVDDDTTDAPKGDQSKADAKQAAKGRENVATGSGDEKEKVEGAENDSADPSRKSTRQRKAGATTTPKPTKKKSSANLKGKTPRSTKKAVVDVDYQPGMSVLAKMRTFPPWPAIILSDELLPEALVRTKPSGKSGKKGEASASAAPSAPTSWPVMFMGTNEYSWMSISNLEPLDDEKLTNAPKGSKNKPLQEAWSVAQNGLNLDDVKSYQDSVEMDVDEFSVEEGAAGPGEGVGAEASPEVDDDLEAEEVDEESEEEEETPKQKKSAKKTPNKKRKKSDSVSDDEDDALPDKPAKTPKKAASAKTPKKSQAKAVRTTKGAKTPSNGTAKSKASGKSAKKGQAKDDKKSPAPRKKAATKSTDRVVDSDSDSAPKSGGKKGGNGEKRTKEILYLRHRMQRGFLSKGKMPIADDMPAMDKYFGVLEGHIDIDGDSIRTTKINKVLKAIVKLDFIPKDDEYRFRKRALALLEKWDKILADKVPGSSPPAAEKENGIKGDDDVEMKDDSKDAGEKESGSEPKAGEKKIVDVSVPLTPTKEADSADATAKAADVASAEKAETAAA